MIDRLRQILATSRKTTVDRARPFASQLTVVSVVLMVVSSFMPWAKSGINYSAPLGGFVIGFIEVFSSQAGYSRWSEAIVFTILILVLVFRPTGILGQQLAERA